jgi:hypothetical protein
MSDAADTDRVGPLPGSLHVSGRMGFDGRVTLELDALRITGEAATETEARAALVGEVRACIGRWQTSPRFRRALAWRRRGVLLEFLAPLQDAEIDELLDVQMGSHFGPVLEHRHWLDPD